VIDLLNKFASEFKSKNAKEKIQKRINKFAEELASKDVLLIDIDDMESMFEPDMVETLDLDSAIEKITLEK
jgi:enoyl-[acyl-carrier-protein] reductase (NADH)